MPREGARAKGVGFQRLQTWKECTRGEAGRREGTKPQQDRRRADVQTDRQRGTDRPSDKDPRSTKPDFSTSPKDKMT